MSDRAPLGTVLVVDDTPDNIDVLSAALNGDYRVCAALNGERALALATTHPQPDIILLDVMMPGMGGHEVLRRLKEMAATRDIPVIFITAMSDQAEERRGLELGAVDYVTKPINPAVVKARVRTHLALSQQNRELARMVRERTMELVRVRFEVIRLLGRAAEFRDNETGLHVVRMSHYTRLIAQRLGEPTEWVDLLFHAAPMHDVGKIGIPDHILLKPGRLDDDEWAVMKRHAEIGAKIIGEDPSDLFRMSREVALCHHEKWDGSGYPRALAGTEIPLSARIVAVTDVFDALTTARPYKSAWSVERAIALIKEESGRHFDPAIVEVFLTALPEVLEIREMYREDEGETLT